MIAKIEEKYKKKYKILDRRKLFKVKKKKKKKKKTIKL